MPTYGVKPLRRLQLGRETTSGTAVAATALWRGVGTLQDALTLKEANEDLGILMGVDRSYISAYLGKLSMDAVPATYEQLPYLFEAGIKAVNTGSQDGTGSDYIYAYPFGTNAANSLNTYTIEGGDNAGAERMAFCYAESIKLSGKGGEAVMMSANWVGQQITPQAFTTSPAIPTVNEILFGHSKLYIDAINGTAGTTQQSATFIGMDLEIKTGIQHVFTGDGTLSYSFIKTTMPEVTLKVTYEHESTSIAEKAYWRAQTPRLLQVKITGPAVTTAGTTYNNYTLLATLPGRWMQFDKIGEQNSNDIIVGTFKSKYNATAAAGPSFTVVNQLTTLT